MLVHAHTDTKWFHALARLATAIAFTQGRISFTNRGVPGAEPISGSAFFYLGDDVKSFIREFGPVCLAVRPEAEAAQEKQDKSAVEGADNGEQRAQRIIAELKSGSLSLALQRLHLIEVTAYLQDRIDELDQELTSRRDELKRHQLTS